jgi:hypothetical protein
MNFYTNEDCHIQKGQALWIEILMKILWNFVLYFLWFLYQFLQILEVYTNL